MSTHDWGFGIPDESKSADKVIPLPHRIIGSADVATMYEDHAATYADKAPMHGQIISDLYTRMAAIHRLTPSEALNVLIYLNAICAPETMYGALGHKDMRPEEYK